MSNVSANVIQSMFNHLTSSYSESEARDILVQKYPDSESLIKEIKPENYRVTSVSMGKVKSVSEPVSIETDGLKTAVKVKTAKPKADKPVKEKKVSNASRAREIIAASTDKSRDSIVAQFMEKLGMEKSVANAYFYHFKAKEAKAQKA